MRALKQLVWSSKRRKLTTVISTLVLVTATAAVAYILGLATGTGTSPSQSFGTAATQPAVVNVALGGPNLIPGGSEPFSVTSDDSNFTAGAVVNSVKYTVTTSNPATCLPSWFTVTDNTTYPVLLPNANGSQPVSSGTLAMPANSGTDQSACQGQTIQLKATLNQ